MTTHTESVQRYFAKRATDQEIVQTLLAHYPTAFIDVMDKIEGGSLAQAAEPFGDYVEAIRSFLINGQMVNAIKLHRAKTGLGLKEAKNHGDTYRLALYESGVPLQQFQGGMWRPGQ